MEIRTNAGRVLKAAMDIKGITVAEIAKSLDITRNAAYPYFLHELPIGRASEFIELLAIEPETLFKAMSLDYFESLSHKWNTRVVVSKTVTNKEAKQEESELKF